MTNPYMPKRQIPDEPRLTLFTSHGPVLQPKQGEQFPDLSKAAGSNGVMALEMPDGTIYRWSFTGLADGS